MSGSQRGRAYLGVLAIVVLALGYEMRRSSALGIPTLNTVAYSGSLLTFGAPDNATHVMSLGLFIAGANDGGAGSAACTTSPASVTCVNGQFSIPASSCATVIQQNPNIEAQVTIDTVPMGLVAVTAVPYAMEAATAASLSVSSSLPASPVVGTVVWNTAATKLEVYDGTTWQSANERPAQLIWTPGFVDFDANKQGQIRVTLTNVGDATTSTNLPTALTVPAGFDRVSDTCGTTLAGNSSCTVLLETTQSGADGLRTGSAQFGGNSVVQLSGTYAHYVSCDQMNAYSVTGGSGTVANGLYYIDPDGQGGNPAIQVYCDNTDGSGWTLAVMISGLDELHSNVNAVGVTPIQPTDTVTKKLSDAQINQIMSQGEDSNVETIRAAIRFKCNGVNMYFNQCVWRATKGLPSNSDPCVVSYTDNTAATVLNSVACNGGTQGVGAHCTATATHYAYCSHCQNGDSSETPSGTVLPHGLYSLGRFGCGNDTVGYGFPGQLWVR